MNAMPVIICVNCETWCVRFADWECERIPLILFVSSQQQKAYVLRYKGNYIHNNAVVKGSVPKR